MKKKKAYVVGTNVSKSLSPLIFNYWFKKYNVDGIYEYKEIKEEFFDFEIKKLLKEENVCGINVTIPFKEKIIMYIDDLDEHSKLIGAVNCVSKLGTKTEGTNTDWIGFKECIRKIKKRDVALVLGYGGSAKAIIYCLILLGFKKIRVFNRSFEKIRKLKHITPHTLEEAQHYFDSGDIIINTIPKNLSNEFPTIKSKIKNNNQETGYGFDLVYNHSTYFLENFDNLKRIYGVEMLACQAAPCFYKWFKIMPDIDKKLIEQLMKS